MVPACENITHQSTSVGPRTVGVKLNITIVNDSPDIILDKIDTHSLNWFTNYYSM